MKQKVRIIYNAGLPEIRAKLEEIIANGGEIIQLVNCGISHTEPDWIVIYKQ
jgi:hypothetical protein